VHTCSCSGCSLFTHLFVNCLYRQTTHQSAADRWASDPSAAGHSHSPLYSHHHHHHPYQQQQQQHGSTFIIFNTLFSNKKAVLSQENRAMPQLFVLV